MDGDKKSYNKLPLNIFEQIELLKGRGLIVEDEDKLKYFLTNVSYYHWSVYFKHFQKEDLFIEGTIFDKILNIYIFDNKLRLLLLEVLERVEKSFKSRMAQELSLERLDSHCYMDSSLFVDLSDHQKIIKLITDEVEKSKETSIIHYKNKYSAPLLPPFWTIIEILSFGQCVKICTFLRREYKNKVSRTFGEDEKFIINWMRCLSVLRNHCAHHSLLWNRYFTFIPQTGHKKYGKFFCVGNNKIFNYLVILHVILMKFNPTSSWLDKLKMLLEEYHINVSYMGFPRDWEARLDEICFIDR